MQRSLFNKRGNIVKWVPVAQCYIHQLPNEVYEILSQKIEDVETLINYFSSCKKAREMSLLTLVYDTKFQFTQELPRCRRTFETYLEYLQCYRFTINIENFKSFRIYGLVTDMPKDQLEQMSIIFITPSRHQLSKLIRQDGAAVVDCGAYREIVFDEPEFECKCVDLYSYSEGNRRIELDQNSEFLGGRNAIYEKIDKRDIRHTASIRWKMPNGEFVISFYTGLPTLE